MAKLLAPGKTETDQPEPALQSLAEAQMAGVGSLAWMGTRWAETLSELGAEWLRFVADRVKEDVKTQQELLQAKDIGTVQRIQANFLLKAMDDYQSETGKLVQVCSDAMADMQAKAKTGNDQP